MPPIKIPERVLAWRERQRKGSVMKPKTFKRIKGKARRTGYRTPSAVAGKAYYVTLLSKYLVTHPKDIGVKILLSKLVKRRGKRLMRKNPKGKGIYYKVSGWDGKNWYQLGYTSSKTAFLREALREGWKKSQIRFTPMEKKSVNRKVNPLPKSTLIYDKLLGIEARKGHGKFAGQNFKHDFKDKTDAMVLGNPDGSLTIRSKKGKRLWKKFDY